MARQDEKKQPHKGTQTEPVSTTREAPRFPLGRTLITPAAQAGLDAADIYACLDRHARGDWGECGEADRRENEHSLKRNLRLMSAYRDRNGTKFWIITEADRSATTILLPQDY